MLLVMGDVNAKVESDNTGREREMGSQGCGTINNNGERLVNFCLNNNCAIGGTIFQHKYIPKLTWKSPDGKTVNKIDHAAINNKWIRSLKDVHTSSARQESLCGQYCNESGNCCRERGHEYSL